MRCGQLFPPSFLIRWLFSERCNCSRHLDDRACVVFGACSLLVFSQVLTSSEALMSPIAAQTLGDGPTVSRLAHAMHSSYCISAARPPLATAARTLHFQTGETLLGQDRGEPPMPTWPRSTRSTLRDQPSYTRSPKSACSCVMCGCKDLHHIA